MGKVKNCFWGGLCSELLLVLVQCCAYGTGDIEEQTATLQVGVGEGRITNDFYWGSDDSSSWAKPLQPWKRSFRMEQRMQGNIKTPVPADINEETDAYVEPNILVDPQIL